MKKLIFGLMVAVLGSAQASPVQDYIDSMQQQGFAIKAEVLEPVPSRADLVGQGLAWGFRHQTCDRGQLSDGMVFMTKPPEAGKPFNQFHQVLVENGGALRIQYVKSTQGIGTIPSMPPAKSPSMPCQVKPQQSLAKALCAPPNSNQTWQVTEPGQAQHLNLWEAQLAMTQWDKPLQLTEVLPGLEAYTVRKWEGYSGNNPYRFISAEFFLGDSKTSVYQAMGIQDQKGNWQVKKAVIKFPKNLCNQ